MNKVTATKQLFCQGLSAILGKGPWLEIELGICSIL